MGALLDNINTALKRDTIAGTPVEPPQPGVTLAPSYTETLRDVAPAPPPNLQRKAAVSLAQDTNPDQYARARALGKQLNLPSSLVESNLDDLERRAKLQGIEVATAEAPGVSSMLENLEFAKLAHDDVEPLSAIEIGIAGLTQAGLGFSTVVLDTPNALSRMLGYGAGLVERTGLPPAVNPLRGAQDIADFFARGEIPSGQKLFAGASEAGDAVARAQTTLASDPDTFGPGFAGLAEKGGKADEAFKGLLQGDVSGVAEVLTDPQAWVGFLAQAAPSLYLAYKSGGSLPFIAWLEGMEAARSARDFEQKTGQKISDADFTQAVAQAGAVNAILERTGLDAVLGAPGKGLTGVIRAALGEASTEGLQAFNSNVASLVYDPQADLAEGILPGAMGGFGAGGGFAGGISAANVVQGRMEKRRAKAQAALEHSAALEQINALAAENVTRTRDPAMFRQVVERMAEGAPDLYIDGEVLMQTVEDAGEDAATILAGMPTVAGQLDEAGPTNAVVRVPVAEFLGAASGSGLDAALLPHLRPTPDAPSQNDAEVFFQQEAEQTRTEAERVMTEMAGNDEFTASAQRVEDTLLAELESTGRFTRDVNKTYATLARDFFVTMAARAGTTPEAMYQRYPLKVTEQRTAGQVMGQGETTRGTFSPSTLTISLLNSANPTTFVHELGHFYLEAMGDITSQLDAPAEMQADMAKLLDWFGVPDIATWQSMSLDEQRPHHEKLARGFEAYLFEGKAPSVELQSVFSRLAGWLKRVYKSLTELNVELTDDVRGVFDRMLATEEAIKQAEEALAMEPLFRERTDFPGDDAQWTEYQETTREAHEASAEKLQSRSLRDMAWVARYQKRVAKRFQKEAAEKRKAVAAEVEAELKAERVYAVQEFLRAGTIPEGALEGLSRDQRRTLTESALASTRLSLDALKALYGEGEVALWRYLPTGRNGLVTSKDGSDPELVAQLFGYDSADAMVRDILAAEPLANAVEGLTDTRMVQRYGDLSSPEAIEEAVNEAVHNDVRTRMVATELTLLEKGVGAGRNMTRLLKAVVKRTLNARRVGDIRPAQHVAAETRAAREAAQALKKGKRAEAIGAKRQQLWHNIAAAEARAIEREIEKAVRYVRKFNKAQIKSLPPEYHAQIRALLERFDLRTSVTQDALQRRANLVEWLAEVEAETGVKPAVPTEIENEAYRKHYRQMTLEEFRGLIDTIKQIEHVGHREKRLLDERNKMELDAAAAQALAEADANAPRTVTTSIENTRWRDQIKHYKDIVFAGHEKLVTFWKELDGFKENGFWVRLFQRGANDAGANEGVRMKRSQEALSKLFEPLRKRVGFREMGTPKVVPGAVGADGQPLSLSYQGRLMVVLNMGNEQNYQRMRDGEGWTDETMRAILQTMTKEDMTFVQGVWDHLETYKADLGAQEKAIRGTEPEWVEATPLETEHGTYRGGYMPIQFDSRRATRAREFEDIVDLSAMMAGARGQQSTPRGFLEKRAKGNVRIPLRLDFGVIFNHVTAVNHRLAWENWIIDTRRLLRHPDIRGAINKHLGNEAYTAINNAVTEAALGRAPNPWPLDKAFGHLNNATSIATMGWSATTAAVQFLGVNQSILRLGGIRDGGYRWFAAGMRETFGGRGWKENRVMVQAKSEFMRERSQHMNQSIRHIQQKLKKPGALVKVTDTYFVPMIAMQTLVDMPTWIGAYKKATTQKADGGLEMSEADAVNFADQVVRDAQGSGIVTDLAGTQRGNNAVQIFTRFYMYFNTTLQFNIEILRRQKSSPADYAAAVHDLVLTNIVPSAMMVALQAALFGLDDDDEKTMTQRVFEELGSMLLGQVVGLREFSGMLMGYDYRGPSGIGIVPAVGRLAGQIADGELDQDFARALIDVAGRATGAIPSAQINRTLRGYEALQEGETDRPSALIFGPPR